MLGAIGMDCSKLGFGVMNKSTSPSSPNLADNSSNQGELMLNLSILYYVRMHTHVPAVCKFSG